jgi:DNA-binding NarL/FixJ family response regulator
MKTRILMIDDHRLFLAGLCGLVNKEEDMEVVGIAECGEEGIAMACKLRPDVIVLDLAMPGMSGIEIAKAMRTRLADTKIAVLTMHLDNRMIYEAMKAGIRAYILKEATSQEFLHALRALTNGGIYLSPQVAALLVADYLKAMDKTDAYGTTPKPPLSEREREVLNLLVVGRRTREISEALHISKSTVDTHRRNILDKLGCENVTCLTRYALREGLVNLDE